jgi:hypothetical protein
MPPIGLEVADDALELKFDTEWLASNPLTVADLKREKGFLEAVGYELSFN